jgi:hypothetical protein
MHCLPATTLTPNLSRERERGRSTRSLELDPLSRLRERVGVRVIAKKLCGNVASRQGPHPHPSPLPHAGEGVGESFTRCVKIDASFATLPSR